MNAKDERKSVAMDHLERAKKSLRSAEILLEQELLEDTISRAYYSIYHAVYAMLYFIEKGSKTHKGQMHQFYTHFVVTNIVSKDMNRKINQVLSSRSDADYGSIPIFNNDDAVFGINTAKEMYTIAQEWLEKI